MGLMAGMKDGRFPSVAYQHERTPETGMALERELRVRQDVDQRFLQRLGWRAS